MPLVFDSSAYDKLDRRRTSFSGADIKAIIHRPGYDISGAGGDAMYPNAGGVFHELGSIQTLSVSNYRDKREVRGLGHQHPLGYTRGPRTIGGTLIFALLDTHPFNDDGEGLEGGAYNGILRSSSGFLEVNSLEEDNTAPGDEEIRVEVDIHRRHQYDFTWDSQTFGELMYVDELPPFDIIVTFVSEAGGIGKMVLYGVDIQHEGQTFSIEDLFTEVTYSYTARGLKMFEEGSFRGRMWGGGTTAVQNDYALNALTMPPLTLPSE